MPAFAVRCRALREKIEDLLGSRTRKSRQSDTTVEPTAAGVQQTGAIPALPVRASSDLRTTLRGLNWLFRSGAWKVCHSWKLRNREPVRTAPILKILRASSDHQASQFGPLFEQVRTKLRASSDQAQKSLDAQTFRTLAKRPMLGDLSDGEGKLRFPISKLCAGTLLTDTSRRRRLECLRLLS